MYIDWSSSIEGSIVCVCCFYTPVYVLQELGASNQCTSYLHNWRPYGCYWIP